MLVGPDWLVKSAKFMLVTMGTKYQHEFTFSKPSSGIPLNSEKLRYLNVAYGWIADFC